ncbi:MAG: SOS response-associated peptidase, partial [Gemmatimonadota bacterium]|nr:SOS response-associated peptidase [Gemmatimonadota bacterium]
ESWTAAGVAPKHTFAILTTDANREVSAIHDRMPVIVAPQHRKRWLDRATPSRALADVLAPAPDGTLALREVGNRVNRPDDDDEGLLDPA